MSDKELTVNIVLAILLVLMGVLPALGEIFKRNRLKKIKGITINGIFFFLIFAFTICFAIWKEIISNDDKKESDTALKTSQESARIFQHKLYDLQISMRDTIIKKVDSSYANSIRSSNSALARYNLQLVDSLHNVVGTLKLNSVNSQLTLRPSEKNVSPMFLDSAGGNYGLKIQFISKLGTSYNIKLYCYLISNQFGNNYKLLGKDSIFNGNFVIPDIVSTQEIPLKSEWLKLGPTAIVLSGAFSKDVKDEETIPFYKAGVFDFSKKQFLSNVTYGESSEFKRFLKNVLKINF